MTSRVDAQATATARLPFGVAAPLTTLERVVVLGLVGATLAVGVVYVVVSGVTDPVSAVFQVVVTCLFAGFVISPLLTALVFALAIVCSFLVGVPAETMIAAAIAFSPIVRTGRPWLLGLYSGLFLVALSALGFLTPDGDAATRISIYLLIAIAASLLGGVLRLNRDRERRLAERLRRQAQTEEQVRRAERLRIADELHDVVAHDLTVIVMHTRLMERQADPAAWRETQGIIREAARSALNDMRSLVDQAADDSKVPSSIAGGFAEALTDGQKELQAAGYTVVIDADLSVHKLPRLLSFTLARMLRELITNILKHSSSERASIEAHLTEGRVVLEVRNRFDGRAPSLRLPSGGYGTVRMSERAQSLGGTFRSEPDGHDWLARVEIPLP